MSVTENISTNRRYIRTLDTWVHNIDNIHIVLYMNYNNTLDRLYIRQLDLVVVETESTQVLDTKKLHQIHTALP